MFYHNTPRLCIFFFDTFIRIGRVPVGGCAGLMLFIINVLWKEIIGFEKKKIPKLMLVSTRWEIVRHLSKTGWALLGLSGDFCDKYSREGCGADTPSDRRVRFITTIYIIIICKAGPVAHNPLKITMRSSF